MGRNETTRTAEKSSVKKDVGSNSRKDQRAPSKAGGGASKCKNSVEEALTRVPETVPDLIDYPLASDLHPKLLTPQSGDPWYPSLYLCPPTDISSPGKGKSGPQSVSSAGSPTDPHATRYGAFSTPSGSMSSSFSTHRSDTTDHAGASGIHDSEQKVTENPSVDLCLHDSIDFLPGKVVKLEYFEEEDLSDEKPPVKKRSRKPRKRLTRNEFIAQESARKGKMELFAIFRTYLDYSMAIRIHTYDPQSRKERERLPEYQAILYAEYLKPSVKADDKPPINPPIQVLAYDSEALPKGSRLDYSDTFIVEHNLCVAFVGRIRTTSFPNFASSYQRVQRMLGNEVPLPTQQPPANALAPYSDPESTSKAGPSPTDFVTPPPPFGGPSSPDSVTSEMTSTSSTRRISTEHNAVGGAGWIGYSGSEAPTEQLRHLDFGGTKAETMQGIYSPGSSGYGTGYGGMGAGEVGGQMSRAVEAYTSNSERNEILETQHWINQATRFQRQMMRLVVQPDQTVEALCNLRGIRGDLFVASRVKVAILDTAVNLNSKVFENYTDRLKGYKDFRTDFEQGRPDNHGTHVTSLFLRMAPEADVYVAQAFDSWESLTKAISYALDVWKVDIISISGGGLIKPTRELEQALKHAYYNDVPVFAATHNDGRNQGVSYPARHKTVYPIFSTDSHGEICNFSADPLPQKSYATLGDKIAPLWIDSRTLETISGSSFATPIAAGSYATTLLFARLIYNRTPKKADAAELGREEFTEALMGMLSKPSHSGGRNFGYVNPSLLWQKTTIVQQIKLMMAQVATGEQ